MRLTLAAVASLNWVVSYTRVEDCFTNINHPPPPGNNSSKYNSGGSSNTNAQRGYANNNGGGKSGSGNTFPVADMGNIQRGDSKKFSQLPVSK